MPVSLDQVVALVRQLPASERARLIALVQEDEHITATHFASEKALAKDWLTDDEDRAWQHL